MQNPKVSSSYDIFIVYLWRVNLEIDVCLKSIFPSWIKPIAEYLLPHNQ